jgi:hypothetical protein
MEWLYEIQKELSKEHGISVVVPSYTLAPHGQYPSQLKEAAETLEWLLETEKKKPGNVCHEFSYSLKSCTDGGADIRFGRLGRWEHVSYAAISLAASALCCYKQDQHERTAGWSNSD